MLKVAGGSPHVTERGSLTVNRNTVAPSSCVNDDGNGSAFGSSIFLAVRPAPSPSSPGGAGQPQTVSKVVADQTGLGGGRGNAEAIASPRPAAVR
jgi:hypothetical protein